MARNEPSAMQIILEEVRLLRDDARINNAAMRGDMAAMSEKFEKLYNVALTRANEAYAHGDKSHQRHDKNENRLYGLLFGTGLTGTGIGAAIVKLLS